MAHANATSSVSPNEDRSLAGRSREPYEKPLLRTIHLAAEEVLAVGCKLAGGPGGPIGASCTGSSCFSAGS
ncbi:MAG: hypothetical protein GY719_07210 [bacterium]|nr:hypothetical protein [bacterium]